MWSIWTAPGQLSWPAAGLGLARGRAASGEQGEIAETPRCALDDVEED